MKKILIIGAADHGRVLLDTIKSFDLFEVVGFIDDGICPKTQIDGVRVLGHQSGLSQVLRDYDIDAFVVGIGDNFIRRKIQQSISKNFPDLECVNVIHPSVIISPSAKLGQGIVALANSIIGPNSEVKDGVILNHGAQVDHDCMVKECVSLAPAAVMGGRVYIEKQSAIGIGACINHGINIGKHCVIGSGSVVTKDILDYSVAYGVPAKVVRQRKEGEKYL